MRIFVFEPFTGGACLREDPRNAAASRADRVVRALLRDLSEAPNMEVLTARDARLDPILGSASVRYFTSRQEARSIWRGCVGRSDGIWLVAPGAGRVLERLTTYLTRAGRTQFGSRSCAVAIAASTRRTAQHLRRHGIPVLAPVPAANVTDWSRKWILKRDDASAWSGTRIVASKEDAAPLVAARRGRSEVIAQPYLAGSAVSLTLLCRDGQCRVLSTDLPRVVVVNGSLFRLGQIVNGAEKQGARHLDLVHHLAAALPGLWGIVGVDLLVIGGEAQVVEVTPRLTDAYPGLRDSIGRNPAELVASLMVSDEAFSTPLDRVPIEVEFPLAFGDSSRGDSAVH